MDIAKIVATSYSGRVVVPPSCPEYQRW